jgi:hypothetical protein
MSGVHPHRAARIMMGMMVVITVDVIAASTLQHRGHAAFNSQDVSFFATIAVVHSGAVNAVIGR